MTATILSAKTLVFDGDGRVLVLRRSETHPKKPHHTDLPGGLIEPGEPEVVGMVREVQEETGLVLAPDTCTVFYTHTHMLPSGKSLNMLLYYIRLDHTPEITISWEHESYEWCTLDELLARDDLEQPERTAIEYAVANGLFTS